MLDTSLVDRAAPQLQRLDGKRLADGLGELTCAAFAERVIGQVDMPKTVTETNNARKECQGALDQRNTKDYVEYLYNPIHYTLNTQSMWVN